MRIAILAIALTLAASAGATTRTLRVDYFHTGNHETEIFSLDAVVREPLAWPGNPARPFDDFPRGKYLFEVVDSDSGALLYSRSFSSIYGEWETTAEARRMHRTFHESLRFPEPGAPFTVAMFKRDARNAFREVWRIELDPADYLVRDAQAVHKDAVVAIEHNGDPADKVDLLILGDGYTADETDDFLAKARQLSEALFAVSPFRERRTDFNVWALAPPAARSGVSRPSTGGASAHTLKSVRRSRNGDTANNASLS